MSKVVCLASYYWLGTPTRGTPLRGVPRGSLDLLLGSTGSGRPCLYPASVFPTFSVWYVATYSSSWLAAAAAASVALDCWVPMLLIAMNILFQTA